MKIQKGQEGDNLKVRELVVGLEKLRLHRLDSLTQANQILIRNWLPIDTNPIMHTNDMRRSKGTYFQTMLLE